ncbi:MAG TPA: hypothetical protein VM223_02435, partial [Planctomycetota bacterium]|nr:hypothetical protein [Planctomycetota bacterium]
MAEPNEVVQQVLALFNHADSARLDHENHWNTHWSLYNNEFDFSGKMEWQAQSVIPVIPFLVNFAGDKVESALSVAGRYFVFDAPGMQGQEVALIGEMITRDWMNRPEVKFVRGIREAIRDAMLCGHAVFKPRWRDGIAIDVIDPYDIWLDPTGRDRFLVHRTVRDYDEVLADAEDGIYNLERVKQITGGTGTHETEAWRQRAGLLTPSYASGRRDVELLE